MGQRPYMQMPFQYSLQIEDNKGKLPHFEYLSDENEGPRQSIIEKMLNDLPLKGFNMCKLFEKGKWYML
jgi:hypothetical protein